MIIVVVPPRGPPWVKIQMISKLLKAQIADNSAIDTITGMICGMVMRRKRYQRPAPSTHAASYRSRLTPCMAARKNRLTIGVPTQTSVTMAA